MLEAWSLDQGILVANENYWGDDGGDASRS